MVFAKDVEYGDECWAMHEGRAVAVGTFKSGDLHPSRVFNLPDAADT
jgi:tRNA pseudouridine55 synthase